MARRHSLRFLLVLALSLVMTAGMIVPATADSEDDSIVVTAQVLPYLEVAINPTSHNFGEVPSVWNTADWSGSSGFWFSEFPVTMTVTSNLPYGTIVHGADSSTNLARGTHFMVVMEHRGWVSFGIFPSVRDAHIDGSAALNSTHDFWLKLSLLPNAMPIPPGTINFSVIYTVSQVI
jgi:hypothetical protein